MSEPSFSVAETAAKIGVSRGWLYARCQAQEVWHQRYGRTIRFTPEQIAALELQYASPAAPTLHHLIPGRRRAS